jgi:TolA-binding protein
MAWAYYDASGGKQKALAMPLFTRLEKEYPEHGLGVDATFRLAEEDFAAKRFAPAAERYQRVAGSPQGGPLADKALYKLGWCRRELKDMAGAVLAFRQVPTRNPKSELVPESRLRLGEALAAQNDRAEATRILRELISPQRPGRDDERWLDAQARVALAGIYLTDGEPDAALETARPAANTAFLGTGMRAQLLCGEAQFAQKRWKEAVTEYLKLDLYERVDEVHAQAHYRIGECAEKLGKRDEAKQYWQEVAKNYPDTEWAQKAKERLGK